jgi:hypothetical protein
MLMGRSKAFLALAASGAALMFLSAPLSAQVAPKNPKQPPKATKPEAGRTECGGDRSNRCHRCARFIYDPAQTGGSDGVCQFCKSCGSDCGDKDC